MSQDEANPGSQTQKKKSTGSPVLQGCSGWGVAWALLGCDVWRRQRLQVLVGVVVCGTAAFGRWGGTYSCARGVAAKLVDAGKKMRGLFSDES